jgi:hypothetical protein
MKQYTSGPHRQTWLGGMDETNPPFVLPDDVGALVENAEYVGVGSLVPRRAFRTIFETDEPILYLLFLPYNANGRFCRLAASGQLSSGSAAFSPGASSFAVFFYLRTTSVGGRIGKFSGSSGWEVFVSSSFNPTLVRLAPVTNCCHVYRDNFGFNPTLVRLAQELGIRFF